MFLDDPDGGSQAETRRANKVVRFALICLLFLVFMHLVNWWICPRNSTVCPIYVGKSSKYLLHHLDKCKLQDVKSSDLGTGRWNLSTCGCHRRWSAVEASSCCWWWARAGWGRWTWQKDREEECLRLAAIKTHCSMLMRWSRYIQRVIYANERINRITLHTL